MVNLNQLSQAGSLLSTIGSFQSFAPKQDITTVNGLQEARDFKLNKGERVALIDSNSDILYIKECDDIGKYTLKVFECKEITDKFERENTPAVISKADFDTLMENVTYVMNQLKGNDNGKHNVKKSESEQEQPKLNF